MSGPWMKYQPAANASSPAAAPAGPWAKYQAPQEQGMLSRAGDMVKGAASYVGNLVTGNDRTEFEDVPELANIAAPGNSAGLSAGMLLSITPEQRRDVVKANVPGATFTQDSYGNDLVTLPGGERAYLNKPGFSTQDAANLALFAMPFVKVGQAVRAAPFLGRAGAQALTGAATSAAADKGAQAFGSEQPVSIPRAAETAAFAAAGETLSPILGAIRTRLRTPAPVGGAPHAEAAAIQARLPKSVVDAAKAEGLDVASAPLDLLKQLEQLAIDATDPRDAVRMADAQSLPVPVQMTRGQITAQPGQQMTEDMLRKDVYGTVAGARLRDFDAQQANQLQQNIPALQQRISNAGDQSGIIFERNQGGAAAQAQLASARESLQKQVDDAWSNARSVNAAIPGDVFQQGIFDIRNSVGEGHLLTREAYPVTLGLIRRLEQMSPANGSPSVTVRALQQFRTQLNNEIKPTSSEYSALQSLKRAFDRNIGLGVEAASEGNPDAVQLWRQANAASAELGNRFQSGDLIERLTSTDRIGGQRVLMIEPDKAGDAIFGTGNTPNWGSVSPRDLLRLRTELGKDSDGWNKLREEAFLRMMQPAGRALNGGERSFSGAAVKNAWDSFGQRAPEVRRTLFNPREIAMIDRYVNVAARATNSVRGGSNTSNTAVAGANIITNMAKSLGFDRLLAFIPKFVKESAKEAHGVGVANQALTPLARSSISGGQITGPAAIADQNRLMPQ